jgi:hypothetical protein
MGWDVYGVELSEFFSRYAREVLGLQNVFIGELCETAFADCFLKTMSTCGAYLSMFPMRHCNYELEYLSWKELG